MIDKYLDPGFRNRIPELTPFRVPVSPTTPGSSPGRHVYRFGQISFKRILGEAAPRPEHTGRASLWMGSKQPRRGVQDDAADARIADMDEEGVDAHFLIPTAWTSLVGHDDAALETNVIRAYHRHMEDFCAGHPGRLTSMIVASARNVDAAVQEIRTWGKSKWAVAVMPLVTKDSRPTTRRSSRSGTNASSTICRLRIIALPGRRLISPAFSIYGTTSSSAGLPRILGAPCGSSPR